MEMNYFIMRKDDPITMATFNEDGVMLSYAKNVRNIELAPIQDRYQLSWLKEWWKERSIPLSQGKIGDYLRKRGYSLPSEYLIKNLGLSLTDYYWIKPCDSDLQWKDVNLYENPFSDNLLTYTEVSNGRPDVPRFSPNGSLQGSIEKTWAIDNDGNRCLIKGNKTNLSSESINEVIACEIHKGQGYLKYVPYRLVKIKHRDYDFGCASNLFTSTTLEAVSAFAVYTYEKKPNSDSHYVHLLNMCKKLGMDVETIRRDLEYQIMTDFIMSGYDRHLNNISFMRDADSLEFTGTAPIYDSGGSFFANKAIPVNEKELLNIETYGFCSRETSLLNLVTEPKIIDLSKLPSASFIREAYGKDSQISEKQISNISYWYEKKIELADRFQRGLPLSAISVSMHHRRKGGR